MTDFEERARRRAATWSIEAFDSSGGLVFSRGESTDLLTPAHNNEHALRNLRAFHLLLESLDPDYAGRMERENAPVVFGHRAIP